ncbi:MAG TPA: hypothetical protein VIL34_01440 [Actinopolymorphaceae bacterium]
MHEVARTYWVFDLTTAYEVSSMKEIAKWILGIIVGLVICGYGVVTFNGPVTCGDDVMERGDTCLSMRRGDAENRSYDEQAAVVKRKGIFAIAAGGLIAIGCCVGTVKEVQKQRRPAEVARQ